MYYGKFGLVNYISADRDLYESDILDFKDIGALKLSRMFAAHQTNLWNIYSSIWRMVGVPAIGKSQSVISEYSVKRRVQAVYLDDLFPQFFKHKTAWLTYIDKIYVNNQQGWERLGSIVRQAGVRIVITLRPGQVFDKDIAKLYIKMWKWLGFPTTGNYVVSHRFYVHTSNFKGDLETELNKLPKVVYEKLALIADNVSLATCIKVCRKFGIRASYDISKVRLSSGSRIDINHKLWKHLEDTWRSGKGNSPMLPIVFTSDKLEHSKMEKVLKHYVRKASVVIY